MPAIPNPTAVHGQVRRGEGPGGRPQDEKKQVQEPVHEPTGICSLGIQWERMGARWTEVSSGSRLDGNCRAKHQHRKLRGAGAFRSILSGSRTRTGSSDMHPFHGVRHLNDTQTLVLAASKDHGWGRGAQTCKRRQKVRSPWPPMRASRRPNAERSNSARSLQKLHSHSSSGERGTWRCPPSRQSVQFFQKARILLGITSDIAYLGSAAATDGFLTTVAPGLT